MRLIWTWLLSLASLGATAGIPGLVVDRTTPPPFGHTVGSLIRHQIDIFAPHPWRLKTSRLPGPGPLSDWLEIRRLERRQDSRRDGIHYTVVLTYQIFPPLQRPAPYSIPGLTLTFIGPQQREFSYRLPPWTFTATPLMPGEPATQSLQPLWQPYPRGLQPRWHRLGWYGGGILLTLTILAWHQGWFPRRRTPFRRALAIIRSAARDHDPPRAFLALHRALNETAGYALFHGRLGRFLQQRPEFQPLGNELEEFFQASGKLFFQNQKSSDFLARLESLCQECLRVEKRCRTWD